MKRIRDDLDGILLLVEEESEMEGIEMNEKEKRLAWDRISSNLRHFLDISGCGCFTKSSTLFSNWTFSLSIYILNKGRK